MPDISDDDADAEVDVCVVAEVVVVSVAVIVLVDDVAAFVVDAPVTTAFPVAGCFVVVVSADLGFLSLLWLWRLLLPSLEELLLLLDPASSSAVGEEDPGPLEILSVGDDGSEEAGLTVGDDESVP